MDRRAEASYAASGTTDGPSGVKTVTEAEWLESTEPKKMLKFLRGKASDRKLRLWAAACCRRVWDRFDDSDRQNLEVTERYADDLAPDEERRTFTLSFYHFPFGLKGKLHLDIDPDTAARHWSGTAILHRVMKELGTWSHPKFNRTCDAEEVIQSDLIREVFGNHFRLISIPPAVLAWNDATIVRLAQAAYDERHLPEGALDSGRLAVLADALEEAGCTVADMLGHLRGPGPHVRGCWPVDILLGKS